MSLAAGTQIGKYVVRRKIAEGGMAEIYLCASRGPEGFEKEVVIKRVRAAMAGDPDFVEMFIAEARLASQISHANVVQIFDFDKHEDTYYLAMEYVRGRSLWDVRKRCKERMEPLPPLLVAQIGREVAAALHCAHNLVVGGQPVGLVHRDVTPHNVLLSYDGAVKLTDFGIAKAGNRLSAVGVLKGKFAYMSPEQSRGEPVDARTDVFALGIVLWELLTGGRLFEGDSDIAVLRSVQQSAIAPPRRLNPEVAPALDEAVMKALTRDLQGRFQTAQELERALAAYVFANARSYDDTDVGGFLRRLFAEELEAERVLEQSPAPLPQAAAPAPRLEPEGGRAGTLVLTHGQRPVIAEPPPPPVDASALDKTSPRAPPPAPSDQTVPLARRPQPDTQVTPSAPAARAPRWPLVAGGVALAAALGVVGLRAHRAKTPPRSTPPVKLGAPLPIATPPAGSTKAQETALAPSPVVAPQTQEGEGSPPSGAQDSKPAAPPSAAGQSPQPLPASAGAAKPVPQEPRRAAIPAAAQTEPVSVAPDQEATLVIRAFPWAHLWLDGKKQDDLSPEGRYHLAPGDHTLRFSNERRHKTVKVHLSAGQVRTVYYNALAN